MESPTSRRRLHGLFFPTLMPRSLAARIFKPGSAGAVVAFALLLSVSPAAGARTVSGITEPVHDSLLSATAAGNVKKIQFKEGDKVEEGAVILELDKTLEELEVARRRSVFESRVELDAAEQRANVLRTDYESTKRLFERSQAVSRDDFNKKELEFNLAVAERDRLAATKDRERIEYAIAREQLARRAVTAPFAGVITDVRVELGEACEPRQPVVRVVDLSRGYFVANAAPALTAGLVKGSAVKLRIEVADGEREVSGIIEYIAPVVDAASGLRRVKVIFDNPSGQIAPGAVGQMVLE